MEGWGGYHLSYQSPGRDLGPWIPPERYLGTEIPHKGRRTRDTPFGRVVTLVQPSGADKTPILGAVRLSAHNPEDPCDVTTPICSATPNNRLCVPWLKAIGQRNISNYFREKASSLESSSFNWPQNFSCYSECETLGGLFPSFVALDPWRTGFRRRQTRQTNYTGDPRCRRGAAAGGVR